MAFKAVPTGLVPVWLYFLPFSCLLMQLWPSPFLKGPWRLLPMQASHGMFTPSSLMHRSHFSKSLPWPPLFNTATPPLISTPDSHYPDLLFLTNYHHLVYLLTRFSIMCFFPCKSRWHNGRDFCPSDLLINPQYPETTAGHRWALKKHLLNGYQAYNQLALKRGCPFRLVMNLTVSCSSTWPISFLYLSGLEFVTLLPADLSLLYFFLPCP